MNLETHPRRTRKRKRKKTKKSLPRHEFGIKSARLCKMEWGFQGAFVSVLILHYRHCGRACTRVWLSSQRYSCISVWWLWRSSKEKLDYHVGAYIWTVSHTCWSVHSHPRKNIHVLWLRCCWSYSSIAVPRIFTTTPSVNENGTHDPPYLAGALKRHDGTRRRWR